MKKIDRFTPFVLFVLCVLNADFLLAQKTEIKRMAFNLSVPILINTVDYSFNDGQTFDQSEEGKQKNININFSINNARVSGNNFMGVYVSPEFFRYKQTITVSGRLSNDQKKIEKIVIHSIYTFPPDYSFEWYSMEDIEIYLELSNIPFQISNYAFNHQDVKIDKVEYTLKRFEQRTHNRHEKYEERFAHVNRTTTHRLSGSLNFRDSNVPLQDPVNVSITHDGDHRSKDMAALLQDMLFDMTKFKEVQLYERGEYFEALLKEAVLSTSDVVDTETKINIESVMENYFKEMDVAVNITTTEMEAEEKQWKHTIKMVTKDFTREFEFVLREQNQTSTFVAAIGGPLIQTIHSLQQKKQ